MTSSDVDFAMFSGSDFAAAIGDLVFFFSRLRTLHLQDNITTHHINTTQLERKMNSTFSQPNQINLKLNSPLGRVTVGGR